MTEFSRLERLDTIGDAERQVRIDADASERADLARRFDIVAVDRLEATLAISRRAEGILVDGTVTAAIVQACSVTGDPIPVAIDQPVTLLFVDRLEDGEGEIELSGDAIDRVEMDSAGIDLGEVAAETMALAIDPYLRGPGAEAALRDAGVIGEGEAGPFGALAALKAKLAKE